MEEKKIEVQFIYYLPDHKQEYIRHTYANDMYLALSKISTILWKCRKNDVNSIPVDELWDLIHALPLDEMD